MGPNEDSKSLHDYQSKIAELQVLKTKLQIDRTKKTEQIFDDLQMYGRCASQVATSILLLTGKKSNSKLVCSAQLSNSDKTNIVQAVVTCFLLMVELARFCHERKVHKQMIHAMNYQDFIAIFPHLVLVEYQIILMRTLIRLSISGSLPEQIFARIQLTKMSLPYPYAKFAQKAAKKMYKQCFDQSGNFVYNQLHNLKHPYKKFTKKVPQTWQQIALKANQFADVIEPEYQSNFAQSIQTSYNDTLVKMIHAGIKHDMQILQKLRKEFVCNDLVEKLFDYYAATDYLYSCHGEPFHL